MDQALPMKTGFAERVRREPAAAAALAVLVLSAATIGGAWYFQLIRKLAPCELCLQERIPYYIVVPLALLLTGAVLARAPRVLLTLGFAAIVLAALAGTALGVYHAGVEWHFWAGPTACTGTLTNLGSGGSLLNQLQSYNVVRCDEPAWTLLGISLAGYNVLISLALAALGAWGWRASAG